MLQQSEIKRQLQFLKLNLVKLLANESIGHFNLGGRTYTAVVKDAAGKTVPVGTKYMFKWMLATVQYL